MQRHRRSDLGFSGALALLLLCGSCGSTETPGTIYCGRDYAMRVEAPMGWARQRRESALGLNVKFLPPERATREPAHISVSLPVPRPGTPQSASGSVAALGAAAQLSPSGARSRPLEIAHPRYPSSGIQLVNGDLHAYFVFMDPGSSDRQVLASMQTRGEASEANLDRFTRVIETVDLDPELECDSPPP